jgi:hypothetical protein
LEAAQFATAKAAPKTRSAPSLLQQDFQIAVSQAVSSLGVGSAVAAAVVARIAAKTRGQAKRTQVASAAVTIYTAFSLATGTATIAIVAAVSLVAVQSRIENS